MTMNNSTPTTLSTTSSTIERGGGEVEDEFVDETVSSFFASAVSDVVFIRDVPLKDTVPLLVVVAVALAFVILAAVGDDNVGPPTTTQQAYEFAMPPVIEYEFRPCEKPTFLPKPSSKQLQFVSASPTTGFVIGRLPKPQPKTFELSTFELSTVTKPACAVVTPALKNCAAAD
jgi:hypothetical protein